MVRTYKLFFLELNKFVVFLKNIFLKAKRIVVNAINEVNNVINIELINKNIVFL
jgi:hypothetical protein